jgi:hypothetical protein
MTMLLLIQNWTTLQPISPSDVKEINLEEPETKMKAKGGCSISCGDSEGVHNDEMTEALDIHDTGTACPE